jgi:type VII secretion-associated serine protease mycosin
MVPRWLSKKPTRLRARRSRWTAPTLVAAVIGLAGGLVVASPAAAQASRVDPRQWHLTGWSVERDVWRHSEGEGVVVAVLDTGVDARALPGLGGGVVLEGASMVPGDDGDGRRDDHGHGTFVAGLIASRGTGGGLVGLAPKATILPVRVSSTNELAQGIFWAADNGADVIAIGLDSISRIEDPCYRLMQNAVHYARDRDVVIVAGAGGDGDAANPNRIPASCPGVLAAGATDDAGKPWSKTQRKPYIGVAGPGVSVVGMESTGEITSRSGTGVATALVAGTAALVRARFPELSADRVVQRLAATADDVGPTGRDDQTGHGVVNPGRALTEDVPVDAPNPVDEGIEAATVAPPSGGRTLDDVVPPERERTRSRWRYLWSGLGLLIMVVAIGTAFSTALRHRNPPPLPPPGPGYGPPPPYGPPRYGPPPGHGPPQGYGQPPNPPYGPPMGYGQPSGYGPPPPGDEPPPRHDTRPGQG